MAGGQTGDSGFTMVATMLSLLAAAILTALLLGATLHSGSTSSDRGIADAPGVAQADQLQAQQSLSTALSDAATAAGAAGGYGAVTPALLAGSEPSVTFVSGPSTATTTVSVAVATPEPGLSTTGAGGSITLADRSSDGTCWVVWKGAESGAWYGAQTGLSSCIAPVLTSAPVPGPVTSTGIGWQAGSFPAG